MNFYFSRSLLLFSLLLVFSCASVSQEGQAWENEGYRAELDNGIALYKEGSLFAKIKSFSFNFVDTEIHKMKSITDDGFVLELHLEKADGFHDDFPKTVDVAVRYENNSFNFLSSHPSFKHISVQLEDQQEHYFGVHEKLYPANRKSPDLRGETVNVEVYALGERDYAENYASAYSAFFISTGGYGSFFDTFAKGQYSFAKNGVTEIYHQTDALDWYLFYGPDGQSIHQSYFDVIGAPKSVPVWALGPIVWRDDNDGGKDQILDDMRKFADLNIPLTATFVDRPYSNGGHEWSKMDFNDKFANPEEWIGTLRNEFGLEFMSWVGPMTFGDMDFPGLLPNYRSYIDLTNPEALAEFERRLKTHQYSVGVKGHKMDRADENFPVTARWAEEITESESRNKYVYLYSKVIHEFLERAHGEDQFNFARSAYHRSQPYLSAIWGGDVRPNWEGMASNQANAMRAGFLGFPVWGSDTGGYLGDGFIDEKLYARWLQWGAWNGMFEIKIDGAGGAGKDRAPWRYSEKLQDVFRNAAELRMSLIPYSYSMVNSSASNGVMMKPMAYVFPQDSATYDIWDQYIFGNAFLVAPLFTSEDKREIYFPAGSWYDFNDLSVVHQGPKRMELEYALADAPVFVKANSIFVTGDIYRGSSKLWKGPDSQPLLIHLFPGTDGESVEFTYIDFLDDDKHKSMKLVRDGNATRFESAALTVGSIIQWRLDSKPEAVELNGQSVPFEFDSRTQLLSVAVPAETEIDLRLQ